MYSGVVFLSSFLMSVATIYAAIPVAVRIGLVDKPGGHKLHEDHVPLVGGIAIFLSVFLAWFLAPRLGLASMNSVFVAAGGLLFATGLLDDRFRLSVRLRFAVQIVAALLLVYSNVVLHDLGCLFSDEVFVLGMFGIPLTVFATVGAINALNMIDGVDGLAGLVSSVCFALLLVVAYASGSQIQILLILCVLGAVSGFLLFNMPRAGKGKASVFMGDAGSTSLGFLLAYLLISLSQGGPQRAMSPVTALWIFAIPLIDTLGVMLRRMWLKKSPFCADRGHIHHLLLDAGFRVRQAVLLIAALQLLLGAVGMAAFYLGVPDIVSLLAFLLVFAGYAYLISRPWRVVPRFRELHRKTGLTVQGVRHVYVGNLDSASAVADVEALLGERRYAHAFEIYHAGERDGGNRCTYALINAGETDNVRALVSHLKNNLARINGHVESVASNLAGTVVRQFIIRKPQNDRRCAERPVRDGRQPRVERRAFISRLVYNSEA